MEQGQKWREKCWAAGETCFSRFNRRFVQYVQWSAREESKKLQ